MLTVSTRLPNPIWKAVYALTGHNYAFTDMEKHSNINCIPLRERIRGYVLKRISGEAKSAVGNDSDMLSLFL